MDLLQGYSDDEEDVEQEQGFVERELEVEENQVEYNPDEEEEEEEDHCYGAPPPPASLPAVTTSQSSSAHHPETEDSDEDEGFGPRLPPSSSAMMPPPPPVAVVVPSTTEAGANSEDRIERYMQDKQIPITQEVQLSGHTKAVTCVSIEPAGNRVVTGSLDYHLKLYDFGGMDSRHRAFQSVEAEEGHPIQCISHSPSGDRFIICTSSAQAKVFDRDGKEVLHFIKGDMYLRDLSHTKGHTMEVTAVHWHPTDKNLVVTSSLDGTLRLWDLLGEALFAKLVNKHVLKLKTSPGVSGQGRLAATTCCFNPAGNKIYGGSSDGAIQCWFMKALPHQSYSKPDQVLISAQCKQQAVRNIVIHPNNHILVARYEQGTILLWDVIQGKVLSAIENMPNLYDAANVAFSPDASLLCFCTTANMPTSVGASSSHKTQDKDKEDHKSRLHFFDISDPTRPKEGLSIVVASQNVHAIMVKWHAPTNQIFVTLSNGQIKVFFDSQMSKKGALLSCNKAPRREKDPSDFAVVGEIINPHALPLYRKDNPAQSTHKRVAQLKDPYIAKIPEKPSAQGPGKRENTSFFFTNYVLNQQGKSADLRAEDPREALLKMEEKTKDDGVFFGRAYAKTQPQRILATTTLEQEQEEMNPKKKAKTSSSEDK